MKYRKETTAICYDESLLKQSALFHNHVIPLMADNIDQENDVLPELLPPELNKSQLKLIYRDAGCRIENLEFESAEPLSNEDEREYELEWQFSYLIDFHRRIAPLPICATHGLEPSNYYHVDTIMNEPYPAGFPIDPIFGVPGIRERDNNNKADSVDPAIILSNLDLIDANKLTWEQIVEIRKDKHSINSLKDLQMFMYREFKSEDSQAYIEDVLLQLMRRYKETADKWVFETIQQTLKIGLNKAMVLGIGSSLAAFFFDATISIAAAAGLTTSIGQIAIKFS